MNRRQKFIRAHRQTVDKRIKKIKKKYRVGAIWSDVSKCGYYVTPSCKEVDFYILAEISKLVGMRWELQEDE